MLNLQDDERLPGFISAKQAAYGKTIVQWIVLHLVDRVFKSGTQHSVGKALSHMWEVEARHSEYREKLVDSWVVANKNSEMSECSQGSIDLLLVTRVTIEWC